MIFTFFAPRFHTNFYYPVKTLVDHGHQVNFLTLYQGLSEQHDIVPPIVLGYSTVFQWWNNWRNPDSGKLIKSQYELRYGFPPIFKFFRVLWSCRSDVLIIKDITTVYSLLALCCGWIMGAHLIVMTQIPKFRNKPQSGAVKWLWRLFGGYALTPVQGDSKFSNHNPNLVYVPFTIAHDTTPRQYFQYRNMITVLCVGKFQARKNQILLVEAIQVLRDCYPLRLELVGQEDEQLYFDQLKNYISVNNMSDIVTITTGIPWSKMSEFYSRSDIFVLPSYHEAASYSLLEAMSHSLPVLSSDDNGTQWYINRGKNGFVFRYNNLADLVDKLEQIVGDRNQLIAMGKASGDLVREHHDPAVFYKALMATIKHV